MFNREITYTDYNGVEHTEKFYFNLSRPKLMQMSKLFEDFEKANKEGDNQTQGKIFVEIILSAYGEKSEDGIYFRQNRELSEKFGESAAFEALFTKLTTDPDALQSFFTDLIPRDLQNAAALAALPLS